MNETTTTDEQAELETALAALDIPPDCECWGTNAVGHTDADCPHSDDYDHEEAE